MKKTLKYYLDLQKKLFAAGGPYGENQNYSDEAAAAGYTTDVQNSDTSGQDSGFGKKAGKFMSSQGSDFLGKMYESKGMQNTYNNMSGFDADLKGDFGYTDINNMKKGFKSQAIQGNLQGANAGFKAGSSFGPWGMAIGATVGGMAGTVAPYIGMKKKLQEAEEGNQRANGMARQRFGSNFGLEEKGVYAFGGDMTQFTGGGTHEQNPNNGIDMGNGLAEEGETKHDNFIYSDRLKVNEYLADMFSLPSRTIGKSFADASKLLSKESEERPNDAVSLRSRESMLNRLKEAHMLVLKNMEQQKVGNQIQVQGNEQQIMEPARDEQPQEQQMFGWGGKTGYPDPDDPTKWIDESPYRMEPKGPPSLQQMLAGVNYKNQQNGNIAFDDSMPLKDEVYEPDAAITVDDSMPLKDEIYQDENLPQPVVTKEQSMIEKLKGKDYSKLPEALMYAPALGSLYQYMNLKKPSQISLARLNNKMGVNEVDEDFMARKIREQGAANRYQQGQAMGNNPNALLAGSVLNNNATSNGLSSMIMQAEQENWKRKTDADQFNNAVDQVNVGQANTEEELNARERGAYNTNKSQLFADMMTSAGNIGKEFWNKRNAKEYADAYQNYQMAKSGSEGFDKSTAQLNANTLKTFATEADVFTKKYNNATIDDYAKYKSLKTEAEKQALLDEIQKR